MDEGLSFLEDGAKATMQGAHTFLTRAKVILKLET